MNFGILDLTVLFVYLFFVLIVGIRAGKSKDSKDFFLGGNRLPWQFIMLSIVATETSSLTFLNIPGISYKTNLAFLQVAFGFIIGRIFVSIVLLPLYSKQGFFSVYQWIGAHFGKKAQRYASSAFLITRILGDGVRLYATSIPVALLLGSFLNNWSEVSVQIASLFLISFFTIIYTVYGGFKSVVLTDAIQFVIYLSGGIFSLFFIYYHLPGEWSMDRIFSTASESGKLDIWQGFHGNFFTASYFFINGILGGIFITIGSHGVDQMFVQRLLACKNEKESKYALIGSGIVVFFQFLLFLLIGLLLFMHYGNSNLKTDQVFSKYITENIPSPIQGLLVAAILASAMSTLSSSINSLSLSYLVDWKNIEREDSLHQLQSSKMVSIFWGIVLFLSSILPMFLSDRYSEGLVELGLKIASFTLGPIIGVFLLGRFMKLEMQISGSVFGFALVSSVITTLTITYYLNPALAYIIPTGVLALYLYLFLGSLGSHKRL
jgi:SSS family transporter